MSEPMTVDDLLAELAKGAETGFLIYVGVTEESVEIEFVLGPYDLHGTDSDRVSAPTMLEALHKAVAYIGGAGDE